MFAIRGASIADNRMLFGRQGGKHAVNPDELCQWNRIKPEGSLDIYTAKLKRFLWRRSPKGACRGSRFP